MRVAAAAAVVLFFLQLSGTAVAQGTTVSRQNNHRLEIQDHGRVDSGYNNQRCNYNRTNEVITSVEWIGECRATEAGDARRSYFAVRSFCNRTHYLTALYDDAECASNRQIAATAFRLRTCFHTEEGRALELDCRAGASAVSAVAAGVALLAILLL